MRKPFVAGNWKMNTSRAEAVALGAAVAETAAAFAGVDVAVCPPSVYLVPVAEAIVGGPVALGAQNMYFEAKGAFTGELSASMLEDVGCRCVVLGHSERRHVMGESDELVAKKVSAGFASRLDVILCVGETIEERRADVTENVVRRQVVTALDGVDAASLPRLVIAYEPIWAIGTGETASPEQAQAVHSLIRGLIAEKFGADAANALRIQYGGSVKPDNAARLLAQPDIDGALVGGASLKAAEFAAIIQAAADAGE